MDVNNEYGCLDFQIELLVLLKKFHETCIKNNINYSLIGGSLLGAIRDDGFIPWDDDADIMIARNDFNRLMNLLKNDSILSIKRTLWIWRIQLADANIIAENSYTPTMDLFIVDNMPDGYWRRKMNYYLVSFAEGMLRTSFSLNKFSFINKLIVGSTYIVGKLLTQNAKLRFFDYIVQRYNDKNTEKKAILYAPHHQIHFLYPKDMMDKIILHKFEDTEVCITATYDEVLTMTYGDYMTPPKKKDRKPTHS